MSESRGSIHAITLGTITLCIIASVIGASAKQDKTGAAGLKVAVFDGFRLKTESKLALDLEKQIQKKQEDYYLMLNTWKLNTYLPASDQKRLGDLTVEANTTKANFPADKAAEKKRLEDQSRAYGEEVNKLIAIQVPSPAESDRMKILTRSQSDTQAHIQEEGQRIQNLMQQEVVTSNNRLIKEMRDSVAKVAKEKGISLVLSNDVAWYADADLTEAALTAMNNKK